MNLNDILSFGHDCGCGPDCDCEKEENSFTAGGITVRKLSNDEAEEMASVADTGPLTVQSSYMGGETGLAGKEDTQGSYLGKPSNQFTNSDGTL